tara:strand:- start:140 stop:1120 length:981 start_codon:yes stop_codon:yes gene_type:complete
MKMKIGIVGYKNHAERLRNLVIANEHCELIYVYHPEKKIDHPLATNRFYDLYQSDAVIVSSPNHTHFHYIMELLENFDGYIFCEKPPVIHISDLIKLSKISLSDKNRIYFNYNYRFGSLSSILNDTNYLDKLGEIHHIKIIHTHGLAFKKDYRNSWRADGKNNLHSITDTLAIHYVDLLIFVFGQIKKYFYYPENISGIGTAYDTANIALKIDKISASIFVSYACPLLYDITIIGTDGFLKLFENYQDIHYPRDTFDDNGFFAFPPRIHRVEVDRNKDYLNSLEKSFSFFISHVQEKKEIDVKHFETSLISNKFLLEAQAGNLLTK